MRFSIILRFDIKTLQRDDKQERYQMARKIYTPQKLFIRASPTSGQEERGKQRIV